jgi:hypothetical protein
VLIIKDKNSQLLYISNLSFGPVSRKKICPIHINGNKIYGASEKDMKHLVAQR